MLGILFAATLCCILVFPSIGFQFVRPITSLKHVPANTDHVLTQRERRKRSGSSFTVCYISWYEDSLPNILGINPIEAALLFGALYYLYGPETLYDYARQAGKLFSTYAPMVQQASLDIFSEFKDFIEEDKEREMLKKRGVNINNMPRRTTNILERFATAFETFSKMSETTTSNDSELQRAYRSTDGETIDSKASATFTIEVEEEGTVKKKVKRRKKKDILIAKNVDVEKVIRDAETEGNDGTELTKNLKVVQDRLSLLAKARNGNRNEDDFSDRFGSFGGGYNDPSSAPQYNEYGFPSFKETEFFEKGNDWLQNPSSLTNPPFAQPGSVQATATEKGADSSSSSPNLDAMGTISSQSTAAVEVSAASVPAQPPMSKFQQQLSGKWNQEVMKKNQAMGFDSVMGYDDRSLGSSSVDAPFGTNPDKSSWEMAEPVEAVAGESARSMDDNGSVLIDDFGWNSPVQMSSSISTESWSMSPPGPGSLGTLTESSRLVNEPVNDIPDELSALDVVQDMSSVTVSSLSGAAVRPQYASPTLSDDNLLSPQKVQHNTTAATMEATAGSGTTSTSGLSPEATLELLRELDRDYMALRRRVLSVLEGAQGQTPAQQQTQTLPDTLQVDRTADLQRALSGSGSAANTQS